MSLDDILQVALRLAVAAGLGGLLGSRLAPVRPLGVFTPRLFISAIATAGALSALLAMRFNIETQPTADALAALFQVVALVAGVTAGAVAFGLAASVDDRLAFASVIWIAAMVGTAIGLGAWLAAAVAALLAMALLLTSR